MKPTAIHLTCCLPVALGLGLLAPALAVAAPIHLQNGQITADFDDGGLTGLALANSPAKLSFDKDTAKLTIDGEPLAVPALQLTATAHDEQSVTYTYAAGNKQLKVVYELKPSWQFVSKQLLLTLPKDSKADDDEWKEF